MTTYIKEISEVNFLLQDEKPLRPKEDRLCDDTLAQCSSKRQWPAPCCLVYDSTQVSPPSLSVSYFYQIVKQRQWPLSASSLN